MVEPALITLSDSLKDPSIVLRHLPIGAERLRGGQFHFRIWAPKRKRCALVLAHDEQFGEAKTIPMVRESDGYFSVAVPEAEPGLRYGFRLDSDSRVFPDPASRFQPDGPAMLSQIVDPSQFEWTDENWPGVATI